MAKLSIRDLNLKNKRLFIRVDFNVPLASGGQEITSDKRIKASLPSIKYALEQGAGVVLASHLGRPKGKPNPEMSLKPVAKRLEELLGRPVKMAPDCVGPEVEAMLPKPGEVLLLENLRYHAEEEKNDPAFAKQLAALCDVYVDDAFGSAHRAHASTEGIVRHVKTAAAGLLMAAELEYLGRALEHPERPFAAVLGGAKVSDKLEVIQNLISKVDALVIGGAMAYTFFHARGVPTGKSLVEPDLANAAKEIEQRAKARGLDLELPLDHVVADTPEAGVTTETIDVGDPAIGDRMGLDIGPRTIGRYRNRIASAKTVVWNGPMGVFEIDAFA